MSDVYDMEEVEKARAILEAGRPEEAFVVLKELLESASEESLSRDGWRLHEMIGACFHDMADGEGSVQAYLQAAQSDIYLRSQREHFSNYLFALHYLPGLSNDWLRGQHFIYGSLYRDVEPLPPLEHERHEKMRIGYIAPDFLERSAARFYDVMLTGYDRSRFEVYCYSMSIREDAFTKHVKDGVKVYRCIEELSLEEGAILIQQDELDILFDLGGHSAGGTTLQVMSYRPAPVQISGIGYFDTTGLPSMDYFLTDEILVPRGMEAQFSEKLLRLSSAFAFVPDEAMRSTPSAERLNGETFVFGCFNNFMKLNGEVLETFREILMEFPKARLVLQDTTGMDSRKKSMENRVVEAGFPMNRVDVRKGENEYLRSIADVDVMLDPWPYPGGAMTCTALYMGVPVITLAGTRHGSRFGMSILEAAGLSEFVADNRDEYVANAVALMEDVPRRRLLRKNLRRQLEQSPLMGAETWMRELEENFAVIRERRNDE